MYEVKKTLVILTLTSCVFASLNNQEIVKINPGLANEDFEMRVVHKGSLSIVTFINTDGEATTEVLAEAGYEVERRPGSDECYLKQLDRNEDTDKECTVKLPMQEEELPESVVEFCANSTVYSLEPVRCTGVIGRNKRRLCGIGCWGCGWGICCGFDCRR